MIDPKQQRLQLASNPRRATLADVGTLTQLFAAAFIDDPVFDYMVRPEQGAGLPSIRSLARCLLPGTFLTTRSG